MQLIFVVLLVLIQQIQCRQLRLSKQLLTSINPPKNGIKGSLESNSIQFIDGTSLVGESPVTQVNLENVPEAEPDAVALAGTPPDDVDQLIKELEKLGWNADDSKKALVASNYDVTAAAELLELQQEEMEMHASKVKELQNLGWTEHASEHFISVTDGNVTEASLLMEQTENAALVMFAKNVDAMVSAAV